MALYVLAFIFIYAHDDIESLTTELQPVYASLGNHDSYPEMFSNSDSSWNYDFLSGLWQSNHWLDAQAAQDVKTHFGAYAVSNPPGLQGLKIISINTDFWYADNIFNYVNYTNPDTNDMFKFLISELEESEAAKQRVWIIGHVPSGYGSGDALPNPTALFQSIVVRFSPSTIAAVFWGHTHYDQVSRGRRTWSPNKESDRTG